MIDPLTIITYLRPLLQTQEPSIRVDGAAEFFAAEDRSRLPAPTIYVMLGNFSTTVDSISPLVQPYDARYIFLAKISNTDDRTGKYAQSYVHHLRQILFSYLFGHNFLGGGYYPLIYIGDSPKEMDKAQYWHQFEYSQRGLLAPSDFIPEPVLDKFQRFYADWNLPETGEINHPDAQDHIEHLYDDSDD